MKVIRIIDRLILLLLLFSLFSCATTGMFSNKELVTIPEVYSEDELMGNFHGWEKVEEGVAISSGRLLSQKVQWHCISIDLNTPDLHFTSLPVRGSLGRTFRLKTFARKNRTIAAINTSPFDLAGKTYIPQGITKLAGESLTEANPKYCALCLKKNEQGFWRAEILPNQTEEALKDFDYAYGGFFSVMQNREVLTFAKNRRSRTACGVNDDGSLLYLFVAAPDFYPSDRNGLNYEECALILRALGCKDAMQFDGGHSSGMCLYTKDLEKPVIQRKVPVALGFYK